MVQDAYGRIIRAGDKVVIPATVLQIFNGGGLSKVGLELVHGEYCVIDSNQVEKRD